MNEWIFTSMRRLFVRFLRRLFVRFLEESSASNKTFRDYPTFKTKLIFFSRNINWIVEKLKKTPKLLWNYQKVPIFSTFWKEIFLKSNIRPLKIFLKSNNLCTKKSVAPAIFLKSRFFLKSGFLKSRVYCNWSKLFPPFPFQTLPSRKKKRKKKTLEPSVFCKKALSSQPEPWKSSLQF